MSLPANANPPQRRVNKAALEEGRNALNVRLRGAVRKSTPASREWQELEHREAELDTKVAGLDQGSRGGAAHRPEPTNPNDALRAAFRERRGL